MATFIETIPTYMNMDNLNVFDLKPSGKSANGFEDGFVRVEWFETVFPDIANTPIPLPQEQYEALKAIGECWKINAINWRKNATIEVEGIPADELIQEEEDFMLEMYPPVEEVEQHTDGESTEEPTQQPTEPVEQPIVTEEETTEEV